MEIIPGDVRRLCGGGVCAISRDNVGNLVVGYWAEYAEHKIAYYICLYNTDLQPIGKSKLVGIVDSPPEPPQFIAACRKICWLDSIHLYGITWTGAGKVYFRAADRNGLMAGNTVELQLPNGIHNCKIRAIPSSKP